MLGVGFDDLHPRLLRSAAGAVAQRPDFSAIFNFVLIVPCLFFGLIFHVLLLVPSAHAIIAIYHEREQRKHREIVEAIREHGPPPGWRG